MTQVTTPSQDVPRGTVDDTGHQSASEEVDDPLSSHLSEIERRLTLLERDAFGSVTSHLSSLDGLVNRHRRFLERYCSETSDRLTAIERSQTELRCQIDLLVRLQRPYAPPVPYYPPPSARDMGTTPRSTPRQG
ncbi:unnamed protein product [Peronospora belbahrii]|uniref:Uncharacterized protein n=1 Tax=Peronospora belbahrii TaxID=622444 RepID=A0AAU9KJN5_9STRA|nr:unnamed protein product [Peronospora belbahrii]CAH0518214.1 unnamed protein product [Peronospora belbahrii]